MDIFQRVTDQIIALLDKGVAPWVKPWSRISDGIPRNAQTRRPYRGINVVLLMMEAHARGLDCNQWLTYRQALALGGHVTKGAHGVSIVFYELRTKSGDSALIDNETKDKVIPVLKLFTVFNLVDIEGLPAEYYECSHIEPCWEPEARAEGLIASTGARIKNIGFAHAAYYRKSDHIELPPKGAFRSAAEYYSTALHELTHWSGHESRCNRQFGQRFADLAYSFEELVAEMGSAFLCAHCRLDALEQNSFYLNAWMLLMKVDKRAIFLAASKAQQAADYILALSSQDEALAA